MKIVMITALKKYKMLNKIFLLYFVPKYPIPNVPMMLNNPINDKIIGAVQPPNLYLAYNQVQCRLK